MISLDSPHHKLATIEGISPLVKEAYDKLGKDEVIRLKYNQTNIRRELVKRLDISINNKIVKEINRCLSHHIAIPNAVIKERIQGIYDALDIKRTAKATDLDF